MNTVGSRGGVTIAIAAAAMSMISTFFVPYGYPWPGIAWAFLACAAAVWVFRSSLRPAQRMSDVIDGVEAESEGTATAAGHERTS